jgi:hypothetical protein
MRYILREDCDSVRRHLVQVNILADCQTVDAIFKPVAEELKLGERHCDTFHFNFII